MEYLLQLVEHMDQAVATSAPQTFYAARTLHEELSQLDRGLIPSEARAGFAVAMTDLKRMGTSIPGLPYPAMWATGRTAIVAAIKGYDQQPKAPPPVTHAPPEPYVHPERIDEMRAVTNPSYDLSKLVRLCQELNLSSQTGSTFSITMLVRAILDHVPPVFGMKTFAEVANNCEGPRSFKASMQHLENSSRSIADGHLHTQIRAKETLPNETQTNFRNDLDVLLQEIVRRLK